MNVARFSEYKSPDPVNEVFPEAQKEYKSSNLFRNFQCLQRNIKKFIFSRSLGSQSYIKFWDTV
jgi:hypothetical protein